MAYSAEIDVKVRNLGSITKLEEKLSSISRSVNAINKKRLGGGASGGGGSAKSELSEEQKLIQLANKRLTIQNRGLGVTRQVIDLQTKGKNLDEATNNLATVKALTDQDQLDLAKNKILLADQQVKKKGIELKVEKDINAETSKRAKFLKGAPTGFTAAQFGPQMAPTKGAGQAAMSIDTITKQSEKRLRIELKLRELEAKGVNTANLRGKMGELVDAQNRKQFGTIKQLNREIGRGIAKEESKLKILQLQNKQRAEEIKSSAKMEAIRQGNFAGSGPGVFGPQPRRSFLDRIKPTKGFDVQSALISGAFPLLFGQGPIGALAGGLGGGIGGMFGTMGGFAGGIAATAIVQQIQSFVDGISKIGQALGPFTQNTQAVTDALGLQGSAQEAQIKLIEQVEGKTAAFNAATALMAREIGQGGVKALEKFGNTSRLMSLEFSRLVLQVQQATARLINFTARVLGLTEALEKGEAQDLVAGAAAGGNKEAQGLVDERANQGFFSKLDNLVNNSFLSKIGQFVPGAPGAAIRGFGDITGAASSLSGQKADEKNLSNKEKLFAVGEKIRIQAGAITNESKLTFKSLQDELDLKNRIIENEKKMSTALAEKVSKVEQEFDFREKTLKTTLEQLTKERDKIKENAEKRFGISKQEQKDIDIANAKIKAQEGLITTNNELRKDSIDLTKELHTEVDKVAEAFKEVGVTIGEDIKNGIKGLIKGTSTLSDLLNNVADKFLDVALNQALFGDILGSKGDKGGGLLGFLGFADGGRPPVNRPSIVGEKGPELFVPRSSGNIIPNNKLGGGNTNNVVVNVDASGSDVQGDEAAAKEIGTLISVAVQGELLKQQRPGGLLSR